MHVRLNAQSLGSDEKCSLGLICRRSESECTVTFHELIAKLFQSRKKGTLFLILSSAIGNNFWNLLPAVLVHILDTQRNLILGELNLIFFYQLAMLHIQFSLGIIGCDFPLMSIGFVVNYSQAQFELVPVKRDHTNICLNEGYAFL